jgi:hypothetical protein
MRSHVYLLWIERSSARKVLRLEINATREGSRHITTKRVSVCSYISQGLWLGGRGSRGLRTDLSRYGDADRAVVRHDVGGPGHEYAGGAEEQQQS